MAYSIKSRLYKSADNNDFNAFQAEFPADSESFSSISWQLECIDYQKLLNHCIVRGFERGIGRLLQHPESAKSLLKANDLLPSLWIAYCKKNDELIRLLLEFIYTKKNYARKKNYERLMEYYEWMTENCTKQLMSKFVRETPDFRPYAYRNLKLACIRGGNAKSVNLLLEIGTKVEDFDDEYKCCLGPLNHDADLEVGTEVEDFRESPLRLACFDGAYECCVILLNHGSDPTYGLRGFLDRIKAFQSMLWDEEVDDDEEDG